MLWVKINNIKVIYKMSIHLPNIENAPSSMSYTLTSLVQQQFLFASCTEYTAEFDLLHYQIFPLFYSSLQEAGCQMYKM